ncbi:class I SAM-dependent methyltransferase [Collinsella sp. An2]|uniref:class I SAM-dependent methyltransferase n=1 Tax=Collinsella sp. An2 TaxID=1965585 RepID=UPI000B3A404A|nr:class I SAM-dependent methyltransferase [Collinsella sp. An2]OUP09859.1 hypothetical protein B5F33_03850 [Collinsella sp. An2]
MRSHPRFDFRRVDALRDQAQDRAGYFAADEARDRVVCGRSLACARPTRLAECGAHDPTPSPYAVLDDLLGGLEFDEHSRLLDVGCGTGRVLAYYVAAGLPGRAVGVELDLDLAVVAAAWSVRYPQLSVHAGNVLDLPLADFTHLYLFNPFDTAVLEHLLDKLHAEAVHPVMLVHMSDNGETYSYWGRVGWRLLREGSIQQVSTAAATFDIYDAPQHYSIWLFEPGHGGRSGS